MVEAAADTGHRRVCAKVAVTPLCVGDVTPLRTVLVLSLVTPLHTSFVTQVVMLVRDVTPICGWVVTPVWVVMRFCRPTPRATLGRVRVGALWWRALSLGR
jgi:hypothetical protein